MPEQDTTQYYRIGESAPDVSVSAGLVSCPIGTPFTFDFDNDEAIISRYEEALNDALSRLELAHRKSGFTSSVIERQNEKIRSLEDTVAEMSKHMERNAAKFEELEVLVGEVLFSLSEEEISTDSIEVITVPEEEISRNSIVEISVPENKKVGEQ